MITIFTTPKAFIGEIAMIQKNAIQSWLKMEPKPQVVLIGTEKGVKECANFFNIGHIPFIEKNNYDTPIVSSIWKVMKNKAKKGDLAYVNTDIILTSSFIELYLFIKKQFDTYLVIGKRYDFLISSQIKFGNKWEEQLKRKVLQKGTLGGNGWIDYFIFTKNMYKNIPDFALGRTFWDKWLVWDSLQKGIPVIDATHDIFAVHQTHTYAHAEGTINVWSGEEARQNVQIAGGWAHGASIADAEYILKNKTIFKKNILKIIFQRILNFSKNIFRVPILFDIAMYLRARRIVQKLGF